MRRRRRKKRFDKSQDDVHNISHQTSAVKPVQITPRPNPSPWQAWEDGLRACGLDTLWSGEAVGWQRVCVRRSIRLPFGRR